MKYESDKLALAQRERSLLKAEVEEAARKRAEREKEAVALRGSGVFLDDVDPRY